MKGLWRERGWKGIIMIIPKTIISDRLFVYEIMYTLTFWRDKIDDILTKWFSHERRRVTTPWNCYFFFHKEALEELSRDLLYDCQDDVTQQTFIKYNNEILISILSSLDSVRVIMEFVHLIDHQKLSCLYFSIL